MKPEDMTPEEKHVLDTFIHSPLFKKPSIRDRLRHRWNWRHLPEGAKDLVKAMVEAGNKIVEKYKKEHEVKKL